MTAENPTVTANRDRRLGCLQFWIVDSSCPESDSGPPSERANVYHSGPTSPFLDQE